MSTDENQAAAEAIYWLSGVVIRFSNQLRHPRQLSLTSVATLAALDRTGPHRITELAALQGVAQPSMTVVVGALEQAGLVAREPDPSDRRAVLVSLTEQGLEYLHERRRLGAAQISALVARLPAEDAAALAAAVPALVRLRELQEESLETGKNPASKAKRTA